MHDADLPTIYHPPLHFWINGPAGHDQTVFCSLSSLGDCPSTAGVIYIWLTQKQKQVVETTH